MPGYIDRSRQTLPDELRDIQLENPEPGPAANPRPAATEVERDATAAEMRHSQMSNQFRVFTPIDIHASNSPLMADLEGRASPADFAQHLPQSHDMTASRIL
ncbi:MAG: hypothetical protein KDD62_14925, partial [Bdellovibrionales bacterium]|nr:hypothetical protein [Bdellovibrionales bacterium]